MADAALQFYLCFFVLEVTKPQPVLKAEEPTKKYEDEDKPILVEERALETGRSTQRRAERNIFVPEVFRALSIKANVFLSFHCSANVDVIFYKHHTVFHLMCGFIVLLYSHVSQVGMAYEQYMTSSVFSCCLS